jgi:hypothetical protein
MHTSELTNRELLLQTLFQNEIKYVTARFCGEGDSGAIDKIEAKSIDDEVISEEELTQIKLPNVHPGRPYQKQDFEKNPLSLAKLIEIVAYAELEAAHGGWEIDAGAHGSVDIHVPTGGVETDERAIEIDYAENEPEYHDYDDEEYNDE